MRYLFQMTDMKANARCALDSGLDKSVFTAAGS